MTDPKDLTPGISPKEFRRLLRTHGFDDEDRIRALAKPLEELVFPERFTVQYVVAQSRATSNSVRSEMRFGGSSPVYRGGFTSRLVLTVEPAAHIPVRELLFEGFSGVRAGDRIEALVTRYEVKMFGRPITGHYDQRAYHLDREYGPQENAVEIAILGRSDDVLRRDRAVDYGSFVKK
ncbi:MAG: hypothetical protein ABIH41_05570 [Nanoarchaeota archaeon]